MAETAVGGATPPLPSRIIEGPLEAGAPFGTRYRILRVLGAGGMGVVYQAWDEELGVAVALKVIRPEVTADPYAARDVERRFKRELLLARQVTHKHVVRIHDLGEIDGIKYITMPYIEGRDLAQVLREQGRLPVPQALRFAKQIAEGLLAAHEAGVVHRDLKPENVMIDAEDQALIMDFGISRSVTGTVTGTATAVGAVIGTLEYMAPEQARGVAVDHRADIYSFGLIVHDMLAGRRRLNSAESALAEMMGRMQQPPPSVRSLVADVPEDLERVVNKCLHPDPDQRYATTAALVEDLRALDASGHAVGVKAPALHHWRTATAALLMLLVAGAGGAVWMWRHRPPQGQTQAAAHEPVSVLIADFQNGTGDQIFEGSLEQALAIAMEGSPFITSYSRTSANSLRTSITTEKSLNESAARLVALRAGVKVVLAGAVAPSGDGYALSLKAIAAPDGKTIAIASASARSKAAVLGAVTDLAAKMRQQLGDAWVDTAQGAETLTASNLEAVRAYSIAQDAAARGRNDEAIRGYEAAIRADASFGRAYSGLATSYFYVGRRDDAERMWKEALKHMDRMTEREKYRTRGTYFLAVTQNYDKAIEEYSNLVRLYPADRVGHNNLAFAYFATLDFAKAREEGHRAVELAPTNVTIRNNYALYAMYSGDFATASSEADQVIKLDPSFYKAYLAKAIAALAKGDEAAARDAYGRMAKTDAVGASTANLGLADMAMYRGRWDEAERLLQAGLPEDRKAQNQDAIAAKLIALAEIDLERGKLAAAMTLAKEALGKRRGEAVAVPAAAIFARAHNGGDARALAAEFGGRLQPQQRAYGRIIEGDLAVVEGRLQPAGDAFADAVHRADLWLAHFKRATFYVQAGLYAEASSDLDACEKRRGEATAVFLDDNPTFRYLATLPYWKARAQEGAGARAEAAKNYDLFLQLRGEGGGTLVEDARKRRAAL